MARKTKAVLIVNAKSRRGKELYAQAKATLQEDGVNLEQSSELQNPADVFAKTEEAIAKGIDLVIVGGGDGTLSAVSGFFVGHRSTLGVLPLGTGNQFARDLNIAADVKAACRVLTEGRMAEVDLGMAGESYFLNVATVGLTTFIVQGLKPEEKRRFGRMAYVPALARALRALRPFRATVTTSKGVQSFEKTLQIVVGNGRYHAGPFPLAPDASITDGKLSGYVVAATNRWGLLRFALGFPSGHQAELEEVTRFSGLRIALETSPFMSVTIDGEIYFRTPIKFGIAPKALRVMVPREFGGTDTPTAGK